MEHSEKIRRIALFEGLAEAQLEELAGIAGLREYRDGQELFHA